MSAPRSLDHNDVTKVLKGTLIAAAGAGLLYLLEFFNAVDVLDESNWYIPIVVSGLSVLVNVVRKFALKSTQ